MTLPDSPDAARSPGEGDYEMEIDALLREFQNRCEAVVFADEESTGARQKERAILRNDLRARLLAARSTPVEAPPSEPDVPEEPPKMICQKVTHLGEGYLHGADDDGPFEVDGVFYCGRCHGPMHHASPSSLSGSASERAPDDNRRRGHSRLVVKDHKIVVERAPDDNFAALIAHAEQRERELFAELTALRGETDRLRAALLAFGHHDADCLLTQSYRAPCTCGFSAAFATSEETR